MTGETKPEGRGLSEAVRQASPYLGVGISLAVTVLVALWGGHALDRKYGTGPLWFLVGAVLGMLGAFYHFYKLYRTFTDRKR